MKKISVVVPVYNTAEYLNKCIDSLLRQTVLPDEIILVDDGSTDASAEICDSYASSRTDLVHVIHQSNGGSASARNRGIEAARGDVLSFIDSDDYVASDFYEKLIAVMEKYETDMAVGEMSVEYDDGRMFQRIAGDTEFCWNTEEALVELNSYRYFYKSFCNALFLKSAIGDLRFPEGKRCEDCHLIYQVVANCKRVAYTAQSIYHYVQRPNSNSRTQRIHMEPVNAAENQIRFFRERYPQILFAAETDCAFACMGIYTAYIRSHLQCPAEILRKMRIRSRSLLPSVCKNRNIPKVKKLQALAFCFTPWLYKLVISRTEHR